MGGLRVWWRAAGARARRAGPPAGPAPVLLEERQVGTGPVLHPRRRARVLGGLRVPQSRRPLARAALPGRLTVARAHGAKRPTGPPGLAAGDRGRGRR